MNNLELADKLQATAAQHYGDLCGMLWDGGAALRKLHTENTALRVTEENLLAEIEKVRNDAKLYWRLRSGSNWPAVFESHDAPEPLRGDALDAAMKGKE